MAWTKIPKENHPLFIEVIPRDPRIKTIKMFGGMCATVNGNMFAGLWDESMMVRLDEASMCYLHLQAPFWSSMFRASSGGR